jgi:Asp-tRNA(Asn)/Glu-tRNA(Gln) amidotransferase C subunit
MSKLKLMSLEILSNIKGASSSESIEKLFDAVRNAVAEQEDIDFINLFSNNSVTVDNLREDIVENSSSIEKQIIIDNFPSQKHNYLVVPKVIEE